MKNILVIHQSAELYGSDKTLLLLLQNLDKVQFNAVVVVPFSGPLVTELEKTGVTVAIAPVLKLYRNIFKPRNLLSFFKDMRTTGRVLSNLHATYKFDIVYSNTLAVLAGAFFAKRNKIKHLWHVHEIIVHPAVIANLYPKILNRYANTIICNSNATKNNLTTRLPKLAEKITVVYNGADKPITTQSAGEFLYLKNEKVVTLVGRISRIKGQRWVLNTYVNHLKESGIKLLFVGSPVPGQEFYKHEAEHFIKANNLEDIVFIHDFTEDLAGVWDVTDVALMPSVEAESFGLVALEAMLFKKPVIASKLGGPMEIVVDNKTGLLVEAGNEKELAGAILKLIDNTQLRQDYAEKGYERAVSEFSLGNYIKSITALLRE